MEIQWCNKMTLELNEDGQPINRAFSKDRLNDRSIDELIGICKGIIIDKVIIDEEIQFLAHWLEVNKDRAHLWPANVLIERITRFLSDKVIDNSEKEDLFNILTQISGSNLIANLSSSLPLCNPPPTHPFPFEILSAPSSSAPAASLIAVSHRRQF